MIPLTAAAWFLVMPIWAVTDPDDWYSQEYELIETEPSLDDIEMRLWLQEWRRKLQTQEVQK